MIFLTAEAFSFPALKHCCDFFENHLHMPFQDYIIKNNQKNV